MILKNWILIIKRRREEERLARNVQKDAEEGRMLAEEIARLAQKEEEIKLFTIKEAKHAEKRIRLAEKEIFLSNERIRDYEDEIKIAEKEILCIEEELIFLTKSKIQRFKKSKINLNSVPSSNMRNYCLNKSSEMVYPIIYITENYVPFISTIPFVFLII